MKNTLILLISIIFIAACSRGPAAIPSSWKSAANGWANITINCRADGSFTMKYFLIETNERYSYDGKCRMNKKDSLELEFAGTPPQMEGRSVSKLNANTYLLQIFKPSTKGANIEIGGVFLYRKR